MTKMILIGGTGRSGTSITKEVLARHADAANLPFEYRFIIDPDGLIDFYRSYSAVWSPYIADRKLKRLEQLLHTLAREPWYHRLMGRLIQRLNRDGRILSPRRYHGWQLNRHLPNFERHTQQLMNRLVDFSFPACWVGTESYSRFPRLYHAPPQPMSDLAGVLGDFVRAVIGDLLTETGKSFFVEDNTWNTLFAREILELLPEARLVHVYRDPRDVVSSLSQQRWSPTSKVQAAKWYRAMMEHWFSIRKALPQHSFIEMKLEALVASPAQTIKHICDFAGISFDAAMLEIDLSLSHSGRWRREFDDEEKTQVMAILADLIEALGYEPA